MRPLALLSFALFWSLACAGLPEDLEGILEEVREAAEEVEADAPDADPEEADAPGPGGKLIERPDPDDPLAGLEELVKELGGKGAADPVGWRELAAQLPPTVKGSAQVAHSGEKSGAMGIKVSTAQATYDGPDGRVELVITDMGGMSGLMRGASMAWATVEVDKETSDGFERTLEIEGFKAFEKYSRSSRSGEVNVLVGDRFVVSANGSGVADDTLRAAVEAVDLSALAKLSGP